MSAEYFSDSEVGPRPRTKEDIGEKAWKGVFALIQAGIEDGSFGFKYPETCPDGAGPIGTDRNMFWAAAQGDIPDLKLPVDPSEVPPYLVVLDLIQFCFGSIGKPLQRKWHSYFDHTHLDFLQEDGQKIFLESINRIFARQGIAYELISNGEIKRLGPEILRESLANTLFHTGDAKLDNLLELARKKFFNPDLTVREESLEKLWDAWERIKTLEAPSDDKKKSIANLLDKVSSNKGFKDILNEEGQILTNVGNHFHIRHFETDKVPLEGSEQIDYLFSRLFALIYFLLRKTGRAG